VLYSGTLKTWDLADGGQAPISGEEREQIKERVVEELRRHGAFAYWDDQMQEGCESDWPAGSIAPFIWVETESGPLLQLPADSGYLAALFATRASEGFRGSGYDWAALAQAAIDNRLFSLQGVICFRPEADLFVAASELSSEAQQYLLDLMGELAFTGPLDLATQSVYLRRFAMCFREICEDAELVADLFSQARPYHREE